MYVASVEVAFRDCMKAWFRSTMFFCDDMQQVAASGYPDLCLCVDSVLGRAVEFFDMQVPLYPFKEDFGLPSFPLEFCYSQRFYSKVVGEKTVDLAFTEVLISDEPEIVRGLSGCKLMSFFYWLNLLYLLINAGGLSLGANVNQYE